MGGSTIRTTGRSVSLPGSLPDSTVVTVMR